MNKRLVARELLLIAKNLIAEDKNKYIYDPDHKHKPQGGGWEKTEKGWTQNKREKKEKKEYDTDKRYMLRHKGYEYDINEWKGKFHKGDTAFFDFENGTVYDKNEFGKRVKDAMENLSSEDIKNYEETYGGKGANSLIRHALDPRGGSFFKIRV